ncbi:MAG TPA: hypothetical protein VF493_12005, partial [Terriglobales bacterium]
ILWGWGVVELKRYVTRHGLTCRGNTLENRWASVEAGDCDAVLNFVILSGAGAAASCRAGAVEGSLHLTSDQ